MNKSWNILFLAGLFEIGWVVGLKHADSILTWVLTAVAIYLSMHLLVLASQKLPVGTAYAVFAGMGTTGTVILEMAVFGEPFRLIKIILILVLLGGVVGLKLVTDKEAGEHRA
ncbi:multidrug resistance protein YkkC [Lentibacillus kapialis]|uniref:Multidrug resistance protein YkkC n=1 Tax=Lentibacillus kapialis TaxID=340214 RepID=A0A917PSC9_9BACI|nr:multidrug resistance protein YkkC [Lentibacillus kapialis]